MDVADPYIQKQEAKLPAKKKAPVRPAWAGYWVPGRQPFADDGWLRRWAVLKEELRLKLPR